MNYNIILKHFFIIFYILYIYISHGILVWHIFTHVYHKKHPTPQKNVAI